jgi:sporulation-control protein spo0M
MGFSDRMRESLGVNGARVGVDAGDGSVRPGANAEATVVITGGAQPAQIDALILRVIEAKRTWKDGDNTLTEGQAMARRDRSGLNPAWSRRVVQETRVEVDTEVAPDAREEIAVAIEIPSNCHRTEPSCVVTLNAQADIKGQIDPTGTAILTVG